MNKVLDKLFTKAAKKIDWEEAAESTGYGEWIKLGNHYIPSITPISPLGFKRVVKRYLRVTGEWTPETFEKDLNEAIDLHASSPLCRLKDLS